MRATGLMKDYIFSGWSFFFRWPIANAREFRPAGVFLGPLLQMLVFLSFSFIAFVLLPVGRQFWAPAFGWVGLSMLTGFFHEDGLADTSDSLGVSKFDSAESLEKIHSTFKDPRLGTFGVSSLVLFWVFRILAVSQAHIPVVLWGMICLFSRATSLAFGLYFSSRSRVARSARSSHIMQSVSFWGAALILIFGLFAGIAFCIALESAGFCASDEFALVSVRQGGVSYLMVLLTSLAACSFVFKALVRRTEALNGDLLGALVCISEVFLTICILRFF